MKIYLFSRTHRESETAFRIYYIKENLKVIKSICLVYFTVVLIIFAATWFFHLDVDKIVNIPGFLKGLSIVFIIVPATYLIAYNLQKRFKTNKLFLKGAQLMVVVFALFLICRGMANTFMAMNNPRNSLTMYMIWLLVVAVFFVLEYYETLFISIFCLIAFSIVLPHYQHNTEELIKNQFVSVLIIIIFYFTSRQVFSYRASHFSQLKTIQEKNLEIENANRLKDDILGIVAHDLRNPLAAIESLSMMMEEDADEDNKENISMIKASCDKARSIINDLIEVARNDSVDNFGLEDVEMNGFLTEVTNQWINSKTGSTQLTFNGTSKAVYYRINKEKMQRVMDNLISNAIKFSVDGDRIEVMLKQEKGNYFIEVKDFGLGIPNEMLPYVFDRFSKAGRKGVRGEDSVGMGLNIARQIIKKHGGDITVESVEQRGTTFTIALPQ